MSAGHARGGRLDKKREAALFDGALEAVPLRGGDAVEVARGAVAEVECEEAEVGVACEEVGDLEGGVGVLSADPDEVFEPGGRPGAGIERVGGVDQCEAEILGAGVTEELSEEELRATAGSGADDFGEGAFREAAGSVIKRRPAGGQGGERGAGGGGKTLGEKAAKRGEICRCAGHGTAWLSDAQEARARQPLDVSVCRGR